jgi:hypothetical protein
MGLLVGINISLQTHSPLNQHQPQVEELGTSMVIITRCRVTALRVDMQPTITHRITAMVVTQVTCHRLLESPLIHSTTTLTGRLATPRLLVRQTRKWRGS